MTQSKKEVAERNARIRAEKLRENLGRRKLQTRQQNAGTQAEKAVENAEQCDQPANSPVG